ncbi:MAG: multicopper oxidase domain-containing protein [Gemmatimonadetes bacterium]|nr:multicopper oxidase domain-containing protein [Gemmatimonadota bacterium]
MKRSAFLKRLSAWSGAAAVAPSAWLAAWGGDTGAGTGPSDDGSGPDGSPLQLPPTLRPDGLSLTAREGTVSLGPGQTSRAWMYDDLLPGPTLRGRTGDGVRMTLVNGLQEETVVHWHGVDAPEHADGHPRLAVGPGATLAYDFTLENRAGTYWYHPHPHERTAIQTYRGMAGFFLVDDADSDALDLPAGSREVPLVLQDKRLDGSGEIVYAPSGPDIMTGFLGDVPFVNGTPFPYLPVDRTLYRFRLLNGSNARIFDLALTTGLSFVLIGNDGGFLERPETLQSILLGPGERVDVLVDFTGAPAGDTVVLQSRAFSLAGPPSSQGVAMDLMRFVISSAPAAPRALPEALPALPASPPTEGVPQQTFSFSSGMGRHRINGSAFQMDRVDARIPLGEPQVWRFLNASPVPHPVHLHSAQFRVRSRIGGRGRLYPWEGGLKDTVLLMPFESVEVVVHFVRHRGLYLMHCHNLEHEDDGMMLNFEVT